MIKQQRHKLILEYLFDKEIHNVEDISKDLEIPLTTLRRDLNFLSLENLINKMHGGASLRTQNIVNEKEFNEKVKQNVLEKEKNAKKAVKLISANECIFLDSGTSIFFLAKILDPNLNLTIVTNSIHNVIELSKKGHKSIFLIGGQFADSTACILGFEAVESIKRYSFDKCFMGVNAIDKDLNVYTTSAEHAQIKIEVIKRSSNSFILADSSKFNSKSFIKFSSNKEAKIIF